MRGELNAAALAGVALVSVLLLQRHPGNASRAPASVRASSVAPAQVAPAQVAPANSEAPNPPVFATASGTRLSYRFIRWMKIEGMQENPLELHYSGLFEVQVLGTLRKESEWDLLVSEIVDGQPGSAVFRMRLSAQGEILALRGAVTDNEAAEEHQSILKDLIAQWAIFENTDTVARYEARMRVLEEDARAVKLEKSKLTYVSGSNAPELLESSHRIRWDRGLGAPSTIEGRETSVTGPERSWRTASSYSLQLSQAAPLNARTLAARLASLGHLDQEQSLALSKSRFGSNPPAPPLEELRSELEGAETSRDQLRVFGKTLRALKAKPELARGLAEAAANAASGSEVFRVIVGALAGAGNPAAQAALRQLYEDPSCDTRARQMILAALTTSEAPLDLSTRELLIRVHRSPDTELAQSAGFALGASLAHGPDEAVKGELLRSLDAARTDAEKAAVLDSIGNSGNLTFFGALQRIGDSRESGAVRGKAVFAARFMSGLPVEQWVRAEASDPDPRVRQAAEETLRFRGERQE